MATGPQSIGHLVATAVVQMCVPLATIGMSDVLTIKLFGGGVVYAVFADMLVRMRLGTAVMRLLIYRERSHQHAAIVYGARGVERSHRGASDEL
ncbi:hypothetical protein [Streptomyces sp. NPDC014995]|uniref:hypothetical protein n=1 Tax=Streptomyces sp. NPDC014995 TaxID=3364936 RepID=UPI0037008F2D